MARKKSKDFTDELMKIDSQIEKCNAEITALQEQKKEILEQKKQAELNLLYNFINNSGKSVQEFITQASA
jgi:predicted  nucleic acid-binding Zn-ribbon protein